MITAGLAKWRAGDCDAAGRQCARPVRHGAAVPSPSPRIVVAGAGSIGCFVGGQLAAAGGDVRFLARPRLHDELAAHGLTLSDRDGATLQTSPRRTSSSASIPRCSAARTWCSCTVKSGATREIAASILRIAPAAAVVVSLQNGVDNAAILRRRCPAGRWWRGWCRSTSPPSARDAFIAAPTATILIDAKAAALAATLATPRLPIGTHADMRALAWGKLLLNLNNALNALAGMPLRERDREPRLAPAAGELHRRGAGGARRRGHPAGEGRGAAAGADSEGAAPARRAVPHRRRGADADRPEGALVDGRRPAERRITEIDQLQGRVVALADAERHAGAGESRRAGAGEGGRGEGRTARRGSAPPSDVGRRLDRHPRAHAFGRHVGAAAALDDLAALHHQVAGRPARRRSRSTARPGRSPSAAAARRPAGRCRRACG